jgi:hypothetical protein
LGLAAPFAPGLGITVIPALITVIIPSIIIPPGTGAVARALVFITGSRLPFLLIGRIIGAAVILG